MLSVVLGALEFPPIDNLVVWPDAIEGTGLNKIAFINLFAVVATSLIFLIGARKKALVPKGMQNLAEASVDFIQKGIIDQAIGHGGAAYLPYLATIFFFVFFGNIFEIIPVIAMPANARMANPAFMGLLTLVFFVSVGIRHHGLRYFKDALFPPGVPKALYLLVTPIEFLSTFIVRPFSLAVRLFANMLAGHILLMTFAVLTIALFETIGVLSVIGIFSFGMLVGLTGFELMVSFLQAYVFAILAAVYIGGALHPDH
ncbi:MAG: F0F1 ATP synthase subunit A [Acidimicrobiales bacterium]